MWNVETLIYFINYVLLGFLFQVISIYGQPENCSNACKEILNVMQQEASANNRG